MKLHGKKVRRVFIYNILRNILMLVPKEKYLHSTGIFCLKNCNKSFLLAVVIHWCLPSSRGIQLRYDINEGLFSTGSSKASHWMMETELFFGLA